MDGEMLEDIRMQFPEGSLIYGYYQSGTPRFFKVLKFYSDRVRLVCIRPTNENRKIALPNGREFGEPFSCKIYLNKNEICLIDTDEFLLKKYPGGNASRKGYLYFDRIQELKGVTISEDSRSMCV